MLKKILIINPYGIGDVLFTLPVIHNLRLAYPEAKIAYLANRRNADFLESNPDIAHVFVYDRDDFVAVYRRNFLEFIRKWFEFFRSIQQERFDLVLDFSLNSTFGFLSALCGIQRRVGYDYRKRGRFLTDKFAFVGYENRHIIEYNLDLLRLIQVPVVTQKMVLAIPQGEIERARAWLSDQKINPVKPLIMVVPGGGASWGKAAQYRRWSAVNYAHLMDKIIENYDAVIILLGDSSEVDLCKGITEKMRHAVFSLAGKTSLIEMAAFFRVGRAALVNDAGPLHVAVASGVRTVSIFGPVDPLIYGPYPALGHQVVIKGLPCQPCYRRFRMASCAHASCLGDLSVEEVYRKVQNIL